MIPRKGKYFKYTYLKILCVVDKILANLSRILKKARWVRELEIKMT